MREDTTAAMMSEMLRKETDSRVERWENVVVLT